MKNVGGIDIQGLSGLLITSSPYIILTNNQAFFGYVPIDSFTNNSSNPFAIQALSNAPEGCVVFLKLLLSENMNVFDTITIKLIIGKRDYLIWDPDRNNSSGPVIHSILQSLGYNGDYKDCQFSSFEHLLNYKSLFINAGVAWNNFVLFKDSYEIKKIVEFIEKGGSVYIEGGECWYFDPLVMHGFDFCPYFGIRPLNDGYSNMGPIEGVYGTFTDRMYFEYNGENFYNDEIDSTGTGFRIFHDQNDNYYCGVANATSIYKTVGVSFELSGLIDNQNSTKAILLDSIMHFFGIYQVGLKEATVETKWENRILLDIEPNPFKGVLNIGLKFPNEIRREKKLMISLKIYDALGRVVKDLSRFVISNLSQADIVWDGCDVLGRRLPAGVYFVQLKSPMNSITEKVVKLK